VPVVLQGIHKRMVRIQKLTRNLFLILHGLKVHHQQQQLSKFLMCYQQFASHAYSGVAEPVSKMASQQEKAFCVLRFEVSSSVIKCSVSFRHGLEKTHLPGAKIVISLVYTFCLLFFQSIFYEKPCYGKSVEFNFNERK